MEPRENVGNAANREEAIRSVASYLISEGHLDEAGARTEARNALQEATRLAVGVFDLGTRRWWLVTLRGLLALAAGVVSIARPLTVAAALVLFFGAWIFIDGVMALISSLSGRRVWHFVLGGLLGIGLGLLIITMPRLSLTLFYVMSAAWAISRGITEIVLGSRIGGGGQLILTTLGILACLLGLALLFLPLPGLIAIGFWFGLYAIAHGVLFIVLSFQLRSARKRRPALREAHV
jgi:uncharacterized membrane protein HdeD (DUF308 family)